MMTSLRRLFWLSVLGAAAFAAWSWWQRDRTSTPADAPQWPPIRTTDPTDTATGADDSAAGAPASDAPVATEGDTVAASSSGTSDDVRGEPPAEQIDGGWVPPVDGTCPEGYPVKANGTSMIYHVPGGRFYDRTIPERCYSSPDLAAADGYRAAKA